VVGEDLFASAFVFGIGVCLIGCHGVCLGFVCIWLGLWLRGGSILYRRNSRILTRRRGRLVLLGGGRVGGELSPRRLGFVSQGRRMFHS